MTKGKKKSKSKPQKAAKPKQQKSESSFVSKIPGLIKDVASIGSLVGSFMGTPFGAQTGSGKLSNVAASKLITAPVTTGLMSRQPNWDFRKAPDMGYGPGIRVSGRLTLGEIAKSMTHNGTTTDIVYYGLASSSGSTTVGGDIQLATSPLSFVVLSPVSPFTGVSGITNEPMLGSYGNSDNIFQKLATCFQRYNIVDATLVYAPTAGTSDEHTIVISWVPDPGIILNFSENNGSGDVPALADVNFAMSIPDSVTTPSWAPATFVLPLDKRLKRDLLYVNDISLSTTGPTDLLAGGADSVVEALEARQLFEGGFIFSGFGVESSVQADSPTYTLGTVFIDLTIDLYQMAMNQAPLVYSGLTTSSLSSTSMGSTESKQVIKMPYLPFTPKPTSYSTKVKPCIASWYKRRCGIRKTGERQVIESKHPPVETGEAVTPLIDVEECYVSVPTGNNKKRKVTPDKVAVGTGRANQCSVLRFDDV